MYGMCMHMRDRRQREFRAGQLIKARIKMGAASPQCVCVKYIIKDKYDNFGEAREGVRREMPRLVGCVWLGDFFLYCGTRDKDRIRKEKTTSFLTCECERKRRRRGERQGGQGKGRIGKSL